MIRRLLLKKLKGNLSPANKSVVLLRFHTVQSLLKLMGGLVLKKGIQLQLWDEKPVFLCVLSHRCGEWRIVWKWCARVDLSGEVLSRFSNSSFSASALYVPT